MDSNHRCLDVGQESSPLDHGTGAVAEVGVEPTNTHQALDLAALPGLRTRPAEVARVGVEPTDHSPRFELGRFAGLRTVPFSGSRGTRTHKRTVPPLVFETSSSSGRMASVFGEKGSNLHCLVQSQAAYR